MQEKPVNFESAEARTKWIIDHADYFVACRLLDRKRERHEAQTLDGARLYAKLMLSVNPKPCLIYAVNGVNDTYVETVKGE